MYAHKFTCRHAYDVIMHGKMCAHVEVCSILITKCMYMYTYTYVFMYMNTRALAHARVYVHSYVYVLYAYAYLRILKHST